MANDNNSISLNLRKNFLLCVSTLLVIDKIERQMNETPFTRKTLFQSELIHVFNEDPKSMPIPNSFLRFPCDLCHPRIPIFIIMLGQSNLHGYSITMDTLDISLTDASEVDQGEGQWLWWRNFSCQD